MNKIIKNGLRRKTTEGQWDIQLPEILWAIRTHVSSSTGFTPYHLMYGKISSEPSQTLAQRIEKGIEDTRRIRNQGRDTIIKSQDRQKKQYDKKQKPQHLIIGDLVLVWRSMIETNFAAKLEPKWEGPYRIQDIRGTSLYLATLQGERLNVPIHINRARKYQHQGFIESDPFVEI
jgi:hypothetical protein